MKQFPYLSVLLCLMIACCAPAPANPPDPLLRPWRDTKDASPAAKAGDAIALHRTFAAARAQLMLPYINGGEDAEGMVLNMAEVLRSVGDDRFCQALVEESPEIRSAVRAFLSEEETRRSSPKTHAMLVDAPMTEWPSDLALEKSLQEAGEVSMAKVPWKR